MGREDRFVLANAAPVKDEHGNVTSGIAVFLDITERKEAEKKISEQQAHMTVAQQISRMGYWSFDIATGVPTWSDMMFEVFGCDPAKGVPHYDDHRTFIHPDDWEAFDKAVQGAINGVSFKMELRVKFPDGSIRHAVTRAFPRANESGHIDTLFGITQDITDLKEMETALEASEAMLRETGRMAKVGGWELFTGTHEMRWTEETYRIHELPQGETPTYEDALAFFHQEDRALLTEAMQKAVDLGEAYDLELRFTTAKGKKLWTHAIGKAVRKDGKTVKLFGSFQDITEQKTANERLQRELAINSSLADLYPALLSASSTMADIAASVLEKARLLTNSEHAYVSEMDETTGDNVGHTLTCISEDVCEVRDDRRVAIPKRDDGLYSGLYGHSLNTLQAFFTNSPETHPSSQGVSPEHIPLKRFLSVPVVVGDNLLGQIALANSDRDYTDDDIAAIVRLAHYYALALERKRWEGALRESEQSLELALSAAHLHMWNLNLGSGELSSSTGAWTLLGFAADTKTMLYDSWMEMIHQEDRTEVSDKLRSVIEGVADFYEIDRRMHSLTGEWRWISVRGAVVQRDEAGSAVRLAGTVTDITSRKQLEEEARIAFESFTNVVESSGDGILVVGDEGSLLYANPSAESLFGNEIEELIAGPFGVPSENVLSEIALTDAQGSPITVEMLASRTTWQGLRAWMLLLRDVTERKQYERAVKESEERLRTVIEASPIGIRIAREGRSLYANPVLVSMLECETADEIIGQPVENMYHPDDRDLVRQQDKLFWDGEMGDSTYFERRGLTKTGKILDLNVWFKKIQYEDMPSLLAFFIDASKEKTLRAQLLQAQKMEAIGTLSGGIAHDFNNVLTVVSGFTEILLLNRQAGDSEYEDLERIATASRRGAELVQGLMAFSRKAETKPRPVNLNRAVDQVVKLMSRTIPKMIAIETRLSEGIKIVNADPGQVEQVLVNLMLNAKDAMPDGGRLTISTEEAFLDSEYRAMHPEATSGDYVRLSVSDTGHGMESSTVNRIFEPFFTTKQPGEGTGLGLAMVYGIMKQHGGSVNCQSRPGQGTTFHLYWPVLRTASEKQGFTPREHVSGGTETLLLVDDDEPVRSLGKRILTRAGYTVLTADNGKDGLDIFQKERERIALVVLDLLMPEMGGKECLTNILEIDPAMKVVLATGYMSGHEGTDPKKLGARALLKKPYEVAGLLTAIRKVLDEP
jgi:PAS domain S-box-containing protein